MADTDISNPTVMNMKQQTIRNSKSSTTALYISNMPFLTIKNVKAILAGDPIRIHLRYIYNLSWIDKQILELLVDSNHADRIKNRIGKNSEYFVKSDFDPLAPDSFNWEGQISVESKKALLKRNFATRLAASIGATKLESTRQCIMTWAKHRGIGPQVEYQLQKEGIVISSSSGNPATSLASDDHQFPKAATDSKSQKDPSTPGPSKFLKRKLSISSNESMAR